MKGLAWPTARGLYAITNGSRPDLPAAAAGALAGGARVLQYRDVTQDRTQRQHEALALRQLCQTHGVPLLIDADVALALAVGADGVHLDDVAGIADARAALGDQAIIGVSCRDSLERAQAAVRAGADYVSFGAFFRSPTRPLAPRASIDLLRRSAALGVPRVAIGGITPDNGGSLIEAGADYLAAISAVFGANDVRQAARRISDLYSPSCGTP